MKRLEITCGNVGGVAKAYAVPVDEFVGINVNRLTGKFTVSIEEGGNLIELAVPEGAISFRETGSEGDNGKMYDVAIDVDVPNNNKDNDSIIDTLVNGQWLLIFQDSNGIVRLAGTKSIPLSCIEDNTTGRNHEEYSKNTLNFHAVEYRRSLVLDQAISDFEID